MKRQREGTEALVYVYGCGAPISGWQHAEAEAERIGILWDRLVGIERAHEAEIATHARADVLIPSSSGLPSERNRPFHGVL